MKIAMNSSGTSPTDSHYNFYIIKTDLDTNHKEKIKEITFQCKDGILYSEQDLRLQVDSLQFIIEDITRQVVTIFHTDLAEKLIEHYKDQGEAIPSETHNNINNAEKDIEELSIAILHASRPDKQTQAFDDYPTNG